MPSDLAAGARGHYDFDIDHRHQYMCGSVACVFTEASKYHPTVSLSQSSRSILEKGEDGAARAPKLEPGRSG